MPAFERKFRRNVNDAGLLRNRITILQRVVTQDISFGSETVDWVELATVWASVEYVLPSRGERLAEGIAIASKPARIRTRYRTDIEADMRVIFEGKTMQIIAGPVMMGQREGLEFMAAEESTEGNVA